MLKMARVVRSHPESHAVDVVMMETGQRFSGVQVLSGVAGGDVGNVDLPEPSVTDPNKPFESRNTGKRDMFAAISFIGDIPFVVGFIYPQVSQVLFGGDLGRNRKLYRHASDVYFTINGNGDTELHHPSGTFFRIGESPAHEALTQLDYDKTFKADRNSARNVNIAVQVFKDGAQKMTLLVTPDGNISVSTQGTVSISSVGNMTLNTGGTMNISATGDVNITGASVNMN